MTTPARPSTSWTADQLAAAELDNTAAARSADGDWHRIVYFKQRATACGKALAGRENSSTVYTDIPAPDARTAISRGEGGALLGHAVVTAAGGFAPGESWFSVAIPPAPGPYVYDIE